MAEDLDFSHRVQQVPAAEPLPETLQRSEKIEVNGIPDYQKAFNDYAANTNWMSALGSAIASAASNQIAKQLGVKAGENPQGDLGPAITDFDKTFENSYKTQSQATLGLQANSLITQSNLEMAKVDRVTPDLIEKTQQQISLGLKNILANAPTEIRPQLEYQYGNLQLEQTSNLTKRMFREQREDMKNNTTLSSNVSAEEAYTFAVNGNDKSGLAAIETAKKINDSQVAIHNLDPATAKTRVDTVRQSYLSGKLIREYEAAKAAGKGEAFLKDLATKKPDDISDVDYLPVTNNLSNYVNHQQALRNQDEQLNLIKFQANVAQNPLSPSVTSQLEDLKNTVSPQAYEKARLHYFNSLRNYLNKEGNINTAIASWKDPGSFARLNEKSINNAFDVLKTKYANDNNISQDLAEVYVASSAGGHVPVFEKSLDNKLTSGNPVSILAASNQMAMLDEMEQGRVYSGVSQKGKAIATLFNQQRGSMPDTDLARQITDNLANIDEPMQKTLNNSWNLLLSAKQAAGLGAYKPLYKFALEEVGFKDDATKFGGPYFAVIYGNDIYNQLNSNFIATRGDYPAALKMTKDYVDQHYGNTYINGTLQTVDNPIEKFLGYPVSNYNPVIQYIGLGQKSENITPYIQKDILNQLSVKFAQSKASNPNDYWETLPFKNNVAEVIRHVKTKDGIKDYRYPINLVGKGNNQWDIVVQTPYGNHNIFLVAPHLGITSYIPNKEAIEKDYNANKKKGWF